MSLPSHDGLPTTPPRKREVRLDVDFYTLSPDELSRSDPKPNTLPTTPRRKVRLNPYWYTNSPDELSLSTPHSPKDQELIKRSKKRKVRDINLALPSLKRDRWEVVQQLAHRERRVRRPVSGAEPCFALPDGRSRKRMMGMRVESLIGDIGGPLEREKGSGSGVAEIIVKQKQIVGSLRSPTAGSLALQIRARPESQVMAQDQLAEASSVSLAGVLAIVNQQVKNPDAAEQQIIDKTSQLDSNGEETSRRTQPSPRTPSNRPPRSSDFYSSALGSPSSQSIDLGFQPTSHRSLSLSPAITPAITHAAPRAAVTTPTSRTQSDVSEFDPRHTYTRSLTSARTNAAHLSRSQVISSTGRRLKFDVGLEIPESPNTHPERTSSVFKGGSGWSEMVPLTSPSSTAGRESPGTRYKFAIGYFGRRWAGERLMMK